MANYAKILKRLNEEETVKTPLKALIVSCSLKKDPKDSNTFVLIQMAKEEFEKRDVEVSVVHLAQLKYSPGVELGDEDGNMDDMSKLLKMVEQYDMLIVASPIWWNNQTSLAQAFMERMTYWDDEGIEKQFISLYGKTFACIISNADDGTQHLMANFYNWAVNLGFTVPPDAFATWTGLIEEGDDRNKKIRSNKETISYIKTMCRNMEAFTRLIKDSGIGKTIQKEKVEVAGYIGANQ